MKNKIFSIVVSIVKNILMFIVYMFLLLLLFLNSTFVEEKFIYNKLTGYVYFVIFAILGWLVYFTLKKAFKNKYMKYCLSSATSFYLILPLFYDYKFYDICIFMFFYYTLAYLIFLILEKIKLVKT